MVKTAPIPVTRIITNTALKRHGFITNFKEELSLKIQVLSHVFESSVAHQYREKDNCLSFIMERDTEKN